MLLEAMRRDSAPLIVHVTDIEGSIISKRGTLAVLPFKGHEFTRPLAILHRKGRVLTPAMKKFIETLGLDLPEMRGT